MATTAAIAAGAGINQGGGIIKGLLSGAFSVKNANTSAKAAEAVAEANYRAKLVQAVASKDVATIQAAAAEYTANTQFAGNVYGADVAANASIQSSRIQAAATLLPTLLQYQYLNKQGVNPMYTQIQTPRAQKRYQLRGRNFSRPSSELVHDTQYYRGTPMQRQFGAGLPAWETPSPNNGATPTPFQYREDTTHSNLQPTTEPNQSDDWQTDFASSGGGGSPW